MMLTRCCKLFLSFSLSFAAMSAEIYLGSNPKHILTDGAHLYVSYGPYSFRDYICVISTANNEIIKKISTGISPEFMILDGAKLFLGLDDFITVVNTQTLEKNTIESPSLSAMFLVGTNIYVANKKDNAVCVIDTITNKRGKNIPVGSYPRAMALANEELYVANSLDGTVTVIDTVTYEVKGSPIRVGGYPTAMLAFGNKIYVTDNRGHTVSVIDTKKKQILGSPIYVASEPGAMIVIKNKLYVADALNDYASIIDTTTDKVIGEIDVGDQPAFFAFANNKLYVTNYCEGTITIKDFN